MAKFGFIRISDKSQNENRQIIEMEKAGVTKEFMFIEKQSGKNFDDRRVYKEMKKRLTSSDIVYFESLSRMGRNRKEVVREFEELNELCAGVVILNMPIINTVKDGTGLGELIANLVIQLTAWSDEEDRLEKKRMQRQGIEIAKKDPTKYRGKPKKYKLDDPKVLHALSLVDSERYTRNQVAELTGISAATLHRLLKERDEKKALQE